MADDDFDLWLGRIGRDGSVRGRLRAGANRAGLQLRRAGRRFTGERIGRGGSVARVLGSGDRHAGPRARRVVVKARFVKLAGKGQAGAVAHLRYLQRDGTTREGERGALYAAEVDAADGKAFLERGSGDRHQFRFIVSAEDGAEYEDLKPLVRRLMTQAEQDLGTRLDWVAVDHFNTGHPHSHILVRGKDDRGEDLVISPEYMREGFRVRATDLVNLDLGPRSDLEISAAQNREVGQERFTGIDRRLLASVREDGLVRPVDADPREQSLRAGRLKTLERMDLAREVRRGQWQLDGKLEQQLRRIGDRGDIIRTLHREMRERLPERAPTDYAIHDPATSPPLIGRVVARGLSDEHADRYFMIVDAVDGRSHYVDIGGNEDATPIGGIVRVTPRTVNIRQADRTIAAIAQANGGRYDVDLHLRHDPTATEEFAETHIRRLEALRRAGEIAERQPDGSWVVAPDHLARIEAHNRKLAGRDPVVIEALSARSLDQLERHDGSTWLDREIESPNPTPLERGFGADVRRSLDLRRQWLMTEGLLDAERSSKPGELTARLQQREIGRLAVQLSGELSLDFSEATPGQRVEGIYRRAVQVGDAKFALIERSRDFTLVPWKPVLERAIGRQVSGSVSAAGIDWQIGRSRGLGIS